MSQNTTPSDLQARLIREDLCPTLLEEISHSPVRPMSGSDTFGARLADAVVQDAWQAGASDVHIEPHGSGMRVRLRIDGILIDSLLLTENQATRLINQLRNLAELDPVKTFQPQESRWTWSLDEHELDIRLTVVPCMGGLKLAMRLLDPARVRVKIDELGMAGEDQQRLVQWMGSLGGMVLVSGPTGSGKTTTLYSMLHELRSRPRSIVTLEDPVEYRIDGITQMQVDVDHDLTFAAGLRAILRMDPDYLMLGEIRDAQTARAAVDAAVAGRVLLTTLHSRDAVSAVSALRNWGLKDVEIGVSLSLVISQRLVRCLCADCRRQEPLTEPEKVWCHYLGVQEPAVAWHAQGCKHCRGLGYRDRAGIFELWRPAESDYDAILAGVDERNLRSALAKRGHQPLLADALRKVRQGITSIAELQTIGDVIPPQHEMFKDVMNTALNG